MRKLRDTKLFALVIEQCFSKTALILLFVFPFSRGPAIALAAMIVAESSLLADAFREINGAAGELDAGSGEIVSATRTLIDITETIKQGSQEIARTCQGD